MKTEAEISHLWQLAHLKFYFGEKLAVHSMHNMGNPAMESAIRTAENEFRVDRLHPEFLDPQAGSAGFGEKPAEDGAGDFPVQSRKKPVAPQARNLPTRIA